MELLSFQALWFVVAGFILGFATSTLWEWLYYRGKRRLQQEPTPPAISSLPRTAEQPSSLEETVAPKPATPWTVPYRSPRVYLESEQPTLAQSAASSAEIPTSTHLSSPAAVPVDSKPRLNPALLATLQSTVADIPIVQTPPRQAVDTPPFTEQGSANTQVYDAPALASPGGVDMKSAIIPQSVPTSVASAVERGGTQFAAPATVQSPGEPPRSPMVEPVTDPDHPDDLAMIKGVGEAYKRRLYNAGIYTWRQVAESELETLRRITRAKPNANITGWRQQAQELAEKYQRWHTTFQGPLDDLTRIDGIGAITADILYKAGICTYEQLAGALPDELAQIVPAPTVGDEIDFDGWLNAAVRLANTKRRNQGLLS